MDIKPFSETINENLYEANTNSFGGPGSGHFGHEGREGKVGGSKPSSALGRATGSGTEHHLSMDDFLIGPGIQKPAKKKADGTVSKSQLAERKKTLESLYASIDDWGMQFDKGEVVPGKFGDMINAYNKLRAGIETSDPTKNLTNEERKAIRGLELIGF